MLDFFRRVLKGRDCFSKALLLLEKCAKDGNLEAQRLLNSYNSMYTQNFNPLQSNISLLKNEEVLNKINKCLKQPSTKKPRKKKNVSRRAARNPKTSK